MATTVRDVMMPGPWTIDAGTSLHETAHYMRAWDVTEVLVTRHGVLCGALSDRDIVVLAIASGRAPSRLSAGECCDADVHCLDVNQPTDDALDFMRSHDLSRLPVVDGDQLVGTAWITDLAIATAHDHPDRLTSA